MNSFAVNSPREKKLLFSMMLSCILPLLDSSIISVILPQIADDTGSSRAYIQWALTGYMLACSIGVILSSYISKRAGVRVAWILAMSGFLFSSLFVGSAFNMATLLVSRCMQGLSAGILMPVTQSIIALHFGKERTKAAMAFIAIPAIFAPAVGPLFGALISEQISWRLAFFINVPLVFISLISGQKVIPYTEKGKQSFNVIVFSFYVLSITLFFLSIEQLSSGLDSSKPVYIIMLLLGLMFSLVTTILNNRSKVKVINLSPLRNKKFSMAISMGFITSALFFSFLIYFPLLKSTSGNISGLSIAFLLSIQGVGAWLARRFIYNNIINFNPFFITGLGILISAASLLFIGREGFTLQFIGFLLRGSGLGLATLSVLSAPFEFCKKEFIHDASALTRVSQQLGGAFGGLLAGMLLHNTNSTLFNNFNSFEILFTLSLLAGCFSLSAAFFKN